MSLYHEAAAVLSLPSSEGGNLKTRIFGNKALKSPPSQVYALALESCKWSSVLKEVIENAQLLHHEKKLSPVLAVLLVHDFLLSKTGISLPSSHGLRASVERHKARLTSELTRARLRRKASSLEALKAQVEAAASLTPTHPRWVRINTLRSSLTDQLGTTFSDFQRVGSVAELLGTSEKLVYVDDHIPNLVATSHATDLIKTEAYKSGAIILQDKASCFPAYLLDPRPEDGDVIDSCAAPGNKTTHLAAIMQSHGKGDGRPTHPRLFAFEKDVARAKVLQKMVRRAGSEGFTQISAGQDFLKVDPEADIYRTVGALLLDPSCSGSGIVGRDVMPELYLPDPSAGDGAAKKPAAAKGKKRKREDDGGKKNKKEEKKEKDKVLVDDDGVTVELASEKDLEARLEALSAFQLTLLLHAFRFPAPHKITYSTCSVHAEENEHVVRKALESDVAKRRGWRILRREDQVRGMREWPVRGDPGAVPGREEIADACIRAYKDDGRGVMGFFVAAFVRSQDDGDKADSVREVDIPEGTADADEIGQHKNGASWDSRGEEEEEEEDSEHGSEWAGFDD